VSLGGILRQRREDRELTQEQVSALAGISKPYLSNIETGKAKNPPTDSVLAGLEKALGFADGELTRMAHLVRTPSDVRQEHEILQAQVHKLRGVVRGLIRNRRDGGQGAEAGVEDDFPETPDGAREVTGLSAGVAVPIINKVAAGYPHHFTDLDYPPRVADEYIRCPDVHDPQAFAAHVVGDSMEPEYHTGDVVIFSPNTPAESGEDCFVRFEDGSTTFKRVYQDDAAMFRLQPLNNVYPAEIVPRERVTGLWRAAFRIQRLGRR